MQTNPPPLEQESLETIARGFAGNGWQVEWLDSHSIRLTPSAGAPHTASDPEGAKC